GTATIDNTNHASLGDQVRDTSSVSSGNNSFSLAGTLTYDLYPTNDCSGTASTSEAKSVAADGTVSDSSLSAHLQAGSYSYKASYSGNSNYSGSNSGCEPFKVDKATSSTSSTVKDGTATIDNTNHASLGDQVRDTSSVSSGNNSFSLAGTLTYDLYPTKIGRASCRERESNSVAADCTVYESWHSAHLQAGSYSYKASYSGNSNYSGSNSGCEPNTAYEATTSPKSRRELFRSTIDNTNHASLGDQVRDTSSVSSGNNSFSLAGTLTYDLYPT